MSGPCEVSSVAVAPVTKQTDAQKAEFERKMLEFRANGGVVTVKLSSAQKRAAKATAKAIKAKAGNKADLVALANALAEATSTNVAETKAKSKAIRENLESQEKTPATLRPIPLPSQEGKFGGKSFERDASVTEITDHRIQKGMLDPHEALRILTEGDSLRIK